MAYQVTHPGDAMGSKISQMHVIPFFLDERNPITDEDFIEWKDIMESWVKSVPDYQRQLLKNIDIPWGRHKGAIIDHMLNRIVLYAPKIKNLYQSLQNARQLDHVWEIIETKLLQYTGSETPLPEYHTCVMPPVHEISMEFGMNINSYCTASNPSIMPMGPNIVLHYILHYKKRGVWNKQFPEPVEEDKEFKDPRNSYSCLICPKTFRNNPKKNIYSARGLLIIHLAKDHGQILKIMRRDMEVDMTSTIDLIKKNLPNLEMENTLTDWAKNQQTSEKMTVVPISIDKYLETTDDSHLVPYNDVYNYNKRTCKLVLKPVNWFHTCIMAEEVSKFLMKEHKLTNEGRDFEGCTVDNPKKIEMDDNKLNLIEHYANHYTKQGAWNDLFPERTDEQKKAYIKRFSNDGGTPSMDSMIEGYSCKKCKNEGEREKTWHFKAWSVDEREVAKKGLINHLAKFHHLLSQTMKKDTCLDMSSVLKILYPTPEAKKVLESTLETKKEDWVDLWHNVGAPPRKYFRIEKKKITTEIENQGAQFKKLVSIPPNLSETVPNHITISSPTRTETSTEPAQNQSTSTKPQNVEQNIALHTSQQNVGQNKSISVIRRNVEPDLAQNQNQSIYVRQLSAESDLGQNQNIFMRQQNVESDLVRNQSTFTNQENIELANNQNLSMRQQNVEPETVKSENGESIKNEIKTEIEDSIKDEIQTKIEDSIKDEIQIEILENDINIDSDNVGTHSSFSLEDLEMIKQEIKIEEVLKLEEDSYFVK